MVKATGTNTYVQYNDKKTSNPSTAANDNADKAKPPTSSSDLYYVLDLSTLKEQDMQSPSQYDESAAILDLSQNTREKLSNNKAIRAREAEEAGAEGDGDGRPPDETQQLTRRLVAAKSTLDVQSILGDAFNSMREWQKLAAEGDEKAIAVVRKLNRLVSRGNRKIRDLNKEMVLRQRQEKAEEAEREQLAIRLRDELEQAEHVRKQRERRYLQDRDEYEDDEPTETGPSAAATEAKIRALAAAMVALKSGSANVGDAVSSGSMSTGDIGIESAEMSDGEVSEDA
jgi:hypothetical protein